MPRTAPSTPIKGPTTGISVKPSINPDMPSTTYYGLDDYVMA